MMTLVNANRMTPPIAPIGLDYVAAAARRAGLDVHVLDLCLTDGPERGCPSESALLVQREDQVAP